MNNLSVPPAPVQAPDVPTAQRYVDTVVRASGTSFYWAMRFLPEEKRRAMFAVYAFCREVDDIADEPAPLSEKTQGLRNWREEIDRLYDSRPEHPIAVALRAPVETFGMHRRDFLAVVDGMEMDAGETLEIADMAELEVYCDRVACAVGRLSCRVFGVEEARGDRVANALGQALQLTNILRDIAEDADRGRLYLPRELLNRHGITDLAPTAVVASPKLADAAQEIAGLAGRRFVEARTELAHCDAKAMRPAIMMMEVYQRIYERLMARGWDKVLEPVGLNKLEKLWLAVRYGIF